MRSEEKARLIERLERQHAHGRGARLTYEELDLLFSKPGSDNAMTPQAEQAIGEHVQIRWLIRRDMTEVLEIENQSFPRPWTDEVFLHCLRQRNCIGHVAEQGDKILGFMIYELHKSSLKILNFAVAPEQRGQGIGRAMIMRLVDKLHQQKRREIFLEVSESNTGAHLFFQRCGFRADGVMKGFFEDNGEDAYQFLYRIQSHPENAGRE